MRVVAIYKQQSDYTREVEEYLFEFKRLTGHDIEPMDPETPDGISFCDAFGIVEYPTLIAVSDDGQMQNMWRGMPLPTMSEVSFYV